jgi:hypothetical protein
MSIEEVLAPAHSEISVKWTSFEITRRGRPAGAGCPEPSEPHDNGNQQLALPYGLRFSPGTYVGDKGYSEDSNEFVL